MRSQTIVAPSVGQELLPGAVDPTGWLAGPRTAVGPGASGSGSVFGSGRADLAGGKATGGTEGDQAAGSQRTGPADGTPSPSARRTAGISERRARRSARARHLRRVGAGSGRQVPLEQDQVQPIPARAPIEQISDQDEVEGYRLGRWARLALTVTVLAAAVVIAVSLMATSGSTALVDVTVTPGDTLWSIAAQAAPDRDPRAVIDEIRQLNDVTGSVLPVGVVLRVPVQVD